MTTSLPNPFTLSQNYDAPKMKEGMVVSSAPSNIAFIKYWGKKGKQIPMNPSLSMTLEQARSYMQIEFDLSGKQKVEFEFEQKISLNFEKKIQQYIQDISIWLPWIKKTQFKILSKNTFPHSAGIASSASSMAALAFGLLNIQSKLFDVETEETIKQKASFIARLGSGSACRSIYGDFVSWGVLNNRSSSDEFAVPVSDIHPLFEKLQDAICIVNSGPKTLSSRAGHALMQDHPFAQARVEQAFDNYYKLESSLREGNWDQFSQIVEAEALALHALMMTSSPGHMLLQPGSLKIIEQVGKIRKKGLKIAYTLDAGPNLHLIYPVSEREKVLDFIQSDLQNFLEDKKWIDDHIGKGPTIHERIP